MYDSCPESQKPPNLERKIKEQRARRAERRRRGKMREDADRLLDLYYGDAKRSDGRLDLKKITLNNDKLGEMKVNELVSSKSVPNPEGDEPKEDKGEEADGEGEGEDIKNS